MSTKKPEIQDVGHEVAEMQARADVCRAVNGGILEMREHAETYLPKKTRETDLDWKARVAEAEFFPAYAHALDAYIGKPLGSPIIVQNVPSEVEPGLENVDMAGQDFDSFARAVLMAGLVDGATWVVADYPQVPAGSTLAQERSMGARPYLVHVPLENLVDYRGEVMADGTHRCVHFRYKECLRVPDGRWGTREVERIRVLEPGLVEVWEEQKTVSGQTSWVLLQELSGPVSLTEIPVACYTPKREGWFEGEPPLEDLAHLNVTHWQSCSHQRHVLNVARTPLLAGDEDARQDTEAPIQIGVKGLILGIKGLRYVEHSGAAIQAGERDIATLEDRMRRVAGQMLVSESGQKSATEAGIEAGEGSSQLRAWVNNFQDFLEECLRLMAAWVGKTDGGTVVLDMEWDEEAVGADVLTALTASRTAGHISRETYLYNLQRADILPPDVTIEEEIARLEMEGPAPMPTATPFKPKGAAQ